jgi:hypothetical protein
MAEALAVVGGAASILSIVDILARSISIIRDLRNEWKDADFAVLNLLTQLTAFRAALTEIQKWTESAYGDEPHHQLRMDLDDSVAWCRILAEMINELVSDLDHDADVPLDRVRKAKFLFSSKSMEDLQRMLDRQTSALTLLVTACTLYG